MGKGSSGEGGREKCAHKLRSSTEAEGSCRHSKRRVKWQSSRQRQQQDFDEELAFQHVSEFVIQDAQVLLGMAACPARVLWKREESQFPKTEDCQSCTAHFHCPAVALETSLFWPPGSMVNHHLLSLGLSAFLPLSPAVTTDG